jgi:hypothetical protein
MQTSLAERSPLVRTAGTVCVIGAIAGALGGVVLAVWPPRVGAERFSYPFDVAGHLAVEAVFALNHLALAVGVIAVAATGAAGRSWLARSSLLLTVAALVVLSGAEVRAMTLAAATYPSSDIDVLDAVYGTASLAIGLGLVLFGAVVARAGRWPGWRRWIVLATGLAVPLLVVPGIMLGFVAGRVVLVIWMLMFAALGLAVQVEADRPATVPAPA